MYRREALLTASSLRLIDAVSQPTGMPHTTALYGRSGWGFPVPEQVSLDAWAHFIKKQPAIVSVPRVSPPPSSPQNYTTGSDSNGIGALFLGVLSKIFLQMSYTQLLRVARTVNTAK